jgi:NAD(P)-dependent dehydrogenase (short-subunit alcohol dehydrogenase family)
VIEVPGRATLRGRTALVTGGGRGIGRAIAIALAAEGARVAVGARTLSEVQQVAAECGEGAFAIQLDVSDGDRCSAVVKEVQDRFGSLQILVNNAGSAISQKFSDLDLETWRHLFQVDLEGPLHLIQAALPEMLRARDGAVIQIASILGRAGRRYMVAYTSAKHALLGLTRGLAAEYPASGVTFNCVCPAFVDTPMTEQAVVDIMGRSKRTREEALAPMLTPQGRLVRPEEIAAVCVLLAGPDGRGINGQAINVDGGWVQS